MEPTNKPIRRSTSKVSHVVTFDGRYWIDPYTLHLHQVDKDFEDHTTSQEVAANQSGRQPRPVIELLATRWQFFLRKMWERDSRFCLFDGAGIWLNPATGRWHDTIRHASPGALSRRVLHQMADALAHVPDSHPDHLFPLPDLLRLRNSRIAPNTPDSAEYLPDQPLPTDTGSLRRLGIATVTDPWPSATIAIDTACPNGTSGHLHRPLMDGTRLLILGTITESGHQSALSTALSAAVDTYEEGDHHLRLPQVAMRIRQQVTLRPGATLHSLVVVWSAIENIAYVCSDGFPLGCVINTSRQDCLRSIDNRANNDSQALSADLRCIPVPLTSGDRLICFNRGLLTCLGCDSIWQVYGDLLSRQPAAVRPMTDELVTDLRKRHEFVLPANLAWLAIEA